MDHFGRKILTKYQGKFFHVRVPVSLPFRIFMFKFF